MDGVFDLDAQHRSSRSATSAELIRTDQTPTTSQLVHEFEQSMLR